MISKLKCNILTTLGDDIESFAVIFGMLRGIHGHECLSVNELVESLEDLIEKKLIECVNWEIIIDDINSKYRFDVRNVSRQELIEVYEPYLSKRIDEKISFDDIGYYFALTNRGSEVWHEACLIAAENTESDQYWSVHLQAEPREVRILARNYNVLINTLEKWKKENQGKRIIPESVIETSQPFKSYYYSKVEPGLMIKFLYDEK